jgi:cytoskeletal protein RodZ
MQTTQISFGERLREERQRRDVALHDIADATKIRVRYLEALEQGQHERLPGFVFAKGYVRAYAETIGADVETLVNAFVEEQRELGRFEEQRSGEVLDALATAVGRQPIEDSSRRLSRWLLGGGILLVALISVVAWMLMPTPPANAPLTATPQIERELPAATIPKLVTEPLNEPVPVPVPVTSEPQINDIVQESREAIAPPLEEVAVESAPTANRLPATIRVSEFGVGTAVRQRVLVGAGKTLQAGDQAVFWNRILDGAKGDQVTHLWTLNGDPVRSIDLNIGGPHWRTYSRIKLPKSGNWSVEARDAAGNLLATESFTALD